MITARDVPDRRGIAVHTSSWLEPEDLTRRSGIKLTTPERTLVDLAVVLGPEALESAIDRAIAARLLDPDRMLATLDRVPRAPGTASCARDSG